MNTIKTTYYKDNKPTHTTTHEYEPREANFTVSKYADARQKKHVYENKNDLSNMTDKMMNIVKRSM